MQWSQNEGSQREIASLLRFKVPVQLLEFLVLLEGFVQTL